MQCPHCGADNPDNAAFCGNCGAALGSSRQAQQFQQPQMQQAAPIPNYLVHAILVTIFCCLPFGIVAIVYAAQVDGKLGVGDYAGARLASDNAKKWALVALFCGLGIAVIYCVFYGAFGIFAATQQR